MLLDLYQNEALVSWPVSILNNIAICPRKTKKDLREQKRNLLGGSLSNKKR